MVVALHEMKQGGLTLDYMYAFRQANKDRLEDAGLDPRHFRKLKAEMGNAAQRKPLSERVRRTLTSLVNLAVR